MCVGSLKGQSPFRDAVQIYIFFKLTFIGIWLIYNVVLVSAVQQSESVVHIHTLF